MSIDPGEWTGWVDGTTVDTPPYLEVIEWGEVSPSLRQTWLENLANKLEAGSYSGVIIENFRPVGGRKTWQPAAVEIIGVVIFLTGRYGVPLVRQWVSDSKKVATKAKMDPFTKKPPFVGKGARDDDAQSALRHLVLWRHRNLPSASGSIVDSLFS